MARIQYKQIEQIAAKFDVSVSRAIWPGEVDAPAVRLGGFKSNIQSAIEEIKTISRDCSYIAHPNHDGIYLTR
jgi:hypothetical protein